MPDSNLTLLDQQIDKYNAHDAAGFAACYHENAMLRELSGRIVALGRPEIEDLYRDVFSRLPQVQVTVGERIVAGAFVVDHEHLTGHPSRSRATVIYELETDLIRNAWFVR